MRPGNLSCCGRGHGLHGKTNVRTPWGAGRPRAAKFGGVKRAADSPFKGKMGPEYDRIEVKAKGAALAAVKDKAPQAGPARAVSPVFGAKGAPARPGDPPPPAPSLTSATPVSPTGKVSGGPKGLAETSLDRRD